MACSFPLKIKDKTKGTEINPRFLLVPCGRCIACVQRKRGDWSFRLSKQLKESYHATFITLTYDEEHIPKSGNLQKSEIQRYFKRVRKLTPDLKYYAVGEYGTNNLRPHYHAIVFNSNNDVLQNEWRNPDKNESLGFTYQGDVNEASIHYVTGYIIEKYGTMDEKTGKIIDTWDSDTIKPFSLMSKGLGKIYLKHNTKFHKSKFTTETKKEGGQNQIIPRYYRDAIFDKQEKKLLNDILQQKMSEQYINDETGEIIDKTDIQGEINKRKNQIENLKRSQKTKNL